MIIMIRSCQKQMILVFLLVHPNTATMREMGIPARSPTKGDIGYISSSLNKVEGDTLLEFIATVGRDVQ